jgi:hypothetical protein
LIGGHVVDFADDKGVATDKVMLLLLLSGCETPLW